MSDEIIYVQEKRNIEPVSGIPSETSAVLEKIDIPLSGTNILSFWSSYYSEERSVQVKYIKNNAELGWHNYEIKSTQECKLTYPQQEC